MIDTFEFDTKRLADLAGSIPTSILQTVFSAFSTSAIE
jgi:hypothetical protein